MRAYITRRILSSILVIVGVSVLTFSMMHLVPGDPVRLMYGHRAVSAETLNIVRHQLGLDLPVPVQFFRYVSHALVGDLGNSIRSRRPVSEEILSRAAGTFELAGAAMLLSIVIGLPSGLLAALRRGSLLDKASMVMAMLGVSTPQFWLGLVLIYVFAVRLNWLPVLGIGAGKGLILPAITLGLGEVGIIARCVRSSMLEVLGQEYLVTARAKGLAERHVILRHALRNALIPVLTIVGLELGYLLAGAVIVEVVFGRPGLGNLAVDGILNRDFPVVQGVVLFTSVVFVTVNTLIDILYAGLDPRIRYE
jgi:ABC-type dipeptide/oligopeptide/nickel transport system permease component